MADEPTEQEWQEWPLYAGAIGVVTYFGPSLGYRHEDAFLSCLLFGGIIWVGSKLMDRFHGW